jgi:hypothetical protein
MPTFYVFANSGKVMKRSDENAARAPEVITTTDTTADDAVAGDLVVVVNTSGHGYAGVAVNDYDAINGELVLDMDGAYDIPVSAITASNTNQAVQWGDMLYYNATDSRIDKDQTDTGICIGMALETLASGTSADIAVQLMRNPADMALAT